MTEFTWNKKPVTSPLGKAGVIGFLILVPVLIIAFFVAFISAMWNHEVGTILGLVALAVVIRVLNLRKKPLALRVPTGSDWVQYLGLTLALAGLWFHVELLVFVGLILSVRFKSSK